MAPRACSSWAVLLALSSAVLLFSFPCAAGALDLPDGETLIKKDDGIAYTDPPVRMRIIPMGVRNKFRTPGLEGKYAWAEVQIDDDEEVPRTYLALPLAYPRARRRLFKPADFARKILISSERDRSKTYFTIDINGDGRMRGKSEQFNQIPLKDRKEPNRKLFGPMGVALRYPADGVVVPYYFVIGDKPGGSRRSSRSRWYFQRRCYAEGRVPDKKGGKLIIIDDNNNALYDDYGEDVMIQEGKPPTLLSSMIIIGGRLYHMRVAPHGTRVFLKEFGGLAGKLDVVSKFSAPPGLSLQALVVQQVDEKDEPTGPSFDLVPGAKKGKRKAKTAITVPIGRYVIVDGLIKKGRKEVRVAQGTMEPIEIKEGETVLLDWGAPFQMSFKGEGLSIGISIRDCGLYGRAGELYLTPSDKPPKVTIRRDSERGKMVCRSRSMKYLDMGLPGRCDAFTFDPGAKAVYYIVIEQRVSFFNKVYKVGPKRIAYDPMAH